MPKPKQKATNLAVVEVADVKKPIVKAFYDRDKEIYKFLQTRLPSHYPATMKANRIQSSKDGKSLKYRINFQTQAGAITNSYYVLIHVDGDSIALTNLTGIRES